MVAFLYLMWFPPSPVPNGAMWKNDEVAKKKKKKKAREGPGEIGSELFSNEKKTELRDQRQKYLFLQAGRRKKHRILPQDLGED